MFVVMNSKNAKVGHIAATYLPVNQTCPESCALKNNDCYAQAGNVGIHNNRLDRLMAAKKLSAYDIVRMEAREITRCGKSADGKALRLHVSGDARTNASAKLLGKAAESWDGKVYSYTHAWREVERASWGRVSILASCENLEQVSQAHARGYAASLVVANHPDDGKAFTVDVIKEDGSKATIKQIPCPAQTRDDVTCESCKLCMDDQKLLDMNACITFAAHGASRKRALKVL